MFSYYGPHRAARIGSYCPNTRRVLRARGTGDRVPYLSVVFKLVFGSICCSFSSCCQRNQLMSYVMCDNIPRGGISIWLWVCWWCRYVCSTSKTSFLSRIRCWKRSETPKRCVTTTRVVSCVHRLFLVASSPSPVTAFCFFLLRINFVLTKWRLSSFHKVCNELSWARFNVPPNTL